jgi:hypothetical protein
MRDSMSLLGADPDLAGPPEYEPDDGEAQLIAEAFADARAELDREARNFAEVIEGQRVRFTAKRGETCTGTVTRVWLRPAADPYVTIKTYDGASEGRVRTFTRCMSAVSPAGEAGTA